MSGAPGFDQHPSETLRAGKGFSLADVDPEQGLVRVRGPLQHVHLQAHGGPAGQVEVAVLAGG